MKKKKRMKKFLPMNLSLPPKVKEETPKDKIEEKIIGTGNFSNFENVIKRVQKDITLREDLSEYLIKSKLGQGASGDVYKVHKKGDTTFYAQKRVSVDKNSMKPRAIVAELQTLYASSCPYIIKLHNCFFTEQQLLMILEYMNCGSLEKIIKVVGKFPESIISKIAKQILCGLDYLHTCKGIVHRDIKPGNILINDKGMCKIADFGMAGLNKKVFTTFLGTMIYMSPERIRGQEHSFNSDLWSMGLTFVEMALGKYPFELESNNLFSMLDIVEDIVKGKKLLNEDEFSKEFIDFVDCCCKINPINRYNAKQALNHPFIKKYEDEKPSFRTWLHKEYIKKRKERIIRKRKKSKGKVNK